MIKQIKGGSELDCKSFMTYGMLFILYIISFFCIYKASVSLFGMLLLYVINIIYSLIVVKDIFGSEKANQIISLVIFIIMFIQCIKCIKCI